MRKADGIVEPVSAPALKHTNSNYNTHALRKRARTNYCLLALHFMVIKAICVVSSLHTAFYIHTTTLERNTAKIAITLLCAAFSVSECNSYLFKYC